MANRMLQTQDRAEIMDWVERREGHAAQVVGRREDATEDFEPEVGALRIGFPGYASEEELEPMSWDAFFEAFDEQDLVFYYEELDDKGHPSNIYQIG